MNRSGGNASKTKKLILEGCNAAKANRKSFQILSESSSISSNRNSSAQSEEDVVPVGGTYPRQQTDSNAVYEERELLVKKLQGQVKELRHKLKILEESVESKDYSLGTIAREKDRAVGEIRRLERINKQLRQQLTDERNHYLEEKEKFCEEMTRYKKKLQEVKTNEVKKPKENKWTPILPISQQSIRWHFNKEKGDCADNNKSNAQLKSSKSQRLTGTKEHVNPLGSFSCSDSQIQKTWSLESMHLYEGNDQSLQMTALKTENAKLRSIICERDERNYELCLRFLRMKHCKNDIRTRFQDLENEYLQVITNLMEKIDEARQEFNFIIDQKFKKPLHSTNAMYLRLVQRNSRMAFENASLRLENQCLKKELKKHSSGIGELGRKIDEASVPDEQDSKPTFTEAKSDGKLKRTKKNVNFKEIRTIYQRNLAFKTSDTDSNYMSKTSTTVPSNGSLTDPKSNESIVEGVKSEAKNDSNKTDCSFQGNALPDEILNKIFKRVDTSSCQTLNSCKGNDGGQPETKKACSEEESESSKKSFPSFEFAAKEASDKALKLKEDSRLPRKINPLDRQTDFKGTKLSSGRKMPNLTDSSTPCESRESIRIRRGVKSRRVISRYLNKESVEGIRWLDYPTRPRNNRVEKHEKIPAFSPEEKTSVKDSCGLQEKIEMSYQELPVKVDNKAQKADPTKTKREKLKYESPKLKSQKVEPRGREEGKTKSRDPMTALVVDTSRSVPETDDHIHDADTSLNSAKTYRVDQNSSMFFKDRSNDITESFYGNHFQSDSQRKRRTEGSKRFSHRLISTSPEQLRSILTESQLEACFRMTPVIVGHATTELDPEFQMAEPNNDIVLQLVIPATTIKKPSSLFINTEEKIKKTLEKETSISGLNPVSCDKVPNQVPSEIRLHTSNLPTSTSTMDVVDLEALNERNNIMLRTLSAPGLLESSWLDPYSICEMRDCSTNT